IVPTGGGRRRRAGTGDSGVVEMLIGVARAPAVPLAPHAPPALRAPLGPSAVPSGVRWPGRRVRRGGPGGPPASVREAGDLPGPAFGGGRSAAARPGRPGPGLPVGPADADHEPQD